MMRLHRIFCFALIVALLASLTMTIAVARGRTPRNGQMCQGYGMREQAKGVYGDKLGLTEDQRAQIRTIREECRQRIEQVITPEQRKCAKQMMSKRREMPAQRGQRAMEQLNVTPDQKARIKDIRNEARERVQNIRADTRLTEQEKTDKIAAVRRVAHNQMLNVLTPEQKEKLKSLREKRPGMGRQHGAGAWKNGPSK